MIAAVQGIATAAGCQLVASCDLAVASETATFATPGVDIGLFCSTPMVALSRNVPRKQAMEMLLTGEPISAHDAREHRPDQPRGRRRHRTRRGDCAGAKGRAEIGLYRQARQGGVLPPSRNEPADAYRYAAEVMTENMMARDAEEGIGAFIEKREPKWQDR